MNIEKICDLIPKKIERFLFPDRPKNFPTFNLENILYSYIIIGFYSGGSVGFLSYIHCLKYFVENFGWFFGVLIGFIVAPFYASFIGVLTGVFWPIGMPIFLYIIF